MLKETVSLFARSKQIVVEILNGFGDINRLSVSVWDWPDLHNNRNIVRTKYLVDCTILFVRKYTIKN